LEVLIVVIIEKSADLAFEKAARKKKQMEEEIKYPEVMESILGEAFVDGEIKEAFNVFDIDSNGYISAQEIRAILKTVGEEPADELVNTMIEMFDSRGNGQVSWEDFYCKISRKVFINNNRRIHLLSSMNL